MVGDTAVDITAGLRAGTAVVGVLWGASSEEELREAGAETLVARPESSGTSSCAGKVAV
jgi:phosphoglycolate phosphatase-like HAD superfamily hydrolase